MAILPEIILFSGAVFILMLNLFLEKKIQNFFYVTHISSIVICAVTIFYCFQSLIEPASLFGGMISSTSFTAFAKIITLILLIIVILLSLNFIRKNQNIASEFLFLMMASTAGGMILISSNDFVPFYLAIELQSLPLYLLASLNKNSEKSSEAGIKYFIIGCLSSGILLFGISLIYQFSGTTNFKALMDLYYLDPAKASAIPLAVMLGFILVMSSMLLKIAAAPFHMWAPDVYEGSPTIVTNFFATSVKFILSLTFLKLFANLILGWNGIDKVMILVSILSFAFGSLGAIFQKDLKRMLAYSSVGHIGFLILGSTSFSKYSFDSCILYMIIYSIISIGSFGFLLILEERTKTEEKFSIQSLCGLSKTHPIAAFSLMIIMLSSAGIPPLAGFFGKFYVISSALAGGLIIPSILAIIFSIVSAFYYLRIVKVMYFDQPAINFTNMANNDRSNHNPDIFNIQFIIFLVAIINITFVFFIKDVMLMISNFKILQ